MDLGKYLNFKQLWRSGSLKNVVMLTSGTVLSQVLPLLFFPILSRLYTPADYGVLGLFMSISMLLMVVSNLQLNYAILIPKDDADALKVLMTGFHVIVFFTIISVAGVVAFGGMVCELLASPELKFWLYLLPVTVLFSGANIQLSAWFNRTGQFKVISSSRIVTSVVTILCSLLFTTFTKGPGGLVISYMLGTLSSFVMLLWSFKRNSQLSLLTINTVKTVLKTHRNFPLYTLPTELISNFAQQLPMFIFSSFSGVQSVGWFSRSRQMLGLPLNYVGSSIAEVYRQKASDCYRNHPEQLRSLFLKTFFYLFAVSVLPFLFIIIFSPTLFAFFFGENWRQAGVYTQCLAVLYFFKFIISPLTFNFYLFDKQRLDLILHTVIIFFTSISLYLGFYIFKMEIYALILFSISYSFVYLIYGVISYRLTFKN